MLKSDENRIVVNDFIQGDPLSEENLDKTLETVNRFRLSYPQKSIWIYSDYRFDEIFNGGVYVTRDCAGWKRREILRNCTVMVDGKYIDELRDAPLPWCGSSNQRVIDLDKSIFKDKVVLYTNQ